MTPIRRGTAKRLGLRLPPPDLVYEVNVSFPSQLRLYPPVEPFVTLARVREAFEAMARSARGESP